MLKINMVAAVCLAASLTTLAFPAEASEPSIADQAAAIFSATGVQGGLVVHLGCDDGRLSAALRKNSAYVVHGLDNDAAVIHRARKHIQSLGLYGPVSAEYWSGALLPYRDNTVNLVVVSKPDGVSLDEVKRILAPRGVAFMNQGTGWTKVVKPLRTGVDEWTHFLHDASGNPVADDSIVGPPRHLQWTAGPRHSRSHEFTPSVQAVVSSGGRIFYLADQGSISSLREPADWKLVARDAHNGILLWEKSVGDWFPHIYGWTNGPRQLQRRLVAVGGQVYVTLGLHAPLSQLDAATGEPITVYADTEGAEEVLCHNGILLVVVRAVTEARLAADEKWQALVAQSQSPLQLRDSRTPLQNVYRDVENQAARTILAIDSHSGKLLWKLAGGDTIGLKPLSLSAVGDRVYCEKRGAVHCFDLRSGERVWVEPASPLRALSRDALVCVSKSKITLLSPDNGKQKWSQPVPLAQVRDVLLIGDSLWMGGGKPYDSGNSKYTGPSWGAYFAVELDLSTGSIVQEITADNPKHHHRCYENKATNRYILGGRRGTEFLDVKSGDYLWHSWARGTCRYGVMPCNGMLYVPPHACGCYITAKLMGFNALAPASEPGTAHLEQGTDRLERGPAYGQSSQRLTSNPPSANWPTFRGDAQRSGRTTSTVPVSLAQKWMADFHTEITAPTVADGMVFIARPDQHELLAADCSTGKPVWTTLAGGRIDSPPTIHNGRVLFGSRDGYVYSVQAEDGAPTWRFRAAPDARRIVANGQVESPSPVHGSLLLDGGRLSFIAGRSSYLDGGLTLYQLDPMTGESLSRTQIYSPDPETGLQPEQYGPNSMPGARSDILAADDQHIYLRDLTFTKTGDEVPDRDAHLFTLTDFLDDTWTHRSYWIFGEQPSISTGCGGRDKNLLYGRVLVFDDESVFGYGRESVHWSNEFEDGSYRIFARRRDADKPYWSKRVPVHIQAMILAGDVIFMAGAGPAPDKNPDAREFSPAPLLLAISAADGSELARYSIPAAPIFNGMAAAGGQILIALEDGQLLCMSGK